MHDLLQILEASGGGKMTGLKHCCWVPLENCQQVEGLTGLRQDSWLAEKLLVPHSPPYSRLDDPRFFNDAVSSAKFTERVGMLLH